MGISILSIISPNGTRFVNKKKNNGRLPQKPPSKQSAASTGVSLSSHHTDFLSLWHVPLMGQLPHPQPQEDFPLFLFRIITTTTATMIANTTSPTTMVPILSKSHVGIQRPPSYYHFTDAVRFFQNSMQTIIPSTAMAAPRPITFKCPVTTEPI